MDETSIEHKIIQCNVCFRSIAPLKYLIEYDESFWFLMERDIFPDSNLLYRLCECENEICSVFNVNENSIFGSAIRLIGRLIKVKNCENFRGIHKQECS